MTTVCQAANASTDRLNGYLHAYGESVRHFFRSQQRSAMLSPMFNLPGRLVLGSYCYYEQLRPLLAEILACAPPEQIGARMRKLCSRANYIHLNSLMLGYFNGREQARLLGSARPDDHEEIAQLLDFWARTARAYRSDERCLPDEAGFSVPILPRWQLDQLTRGLRDDLSGPARDRLRRMLATLELYTFILNGEARIGIFHHGPYPLPGGDTLIVKEFIGLRDEYFPWSATPSRPPCDAVARIVRLRNVRSQIVLMGSLVTDPSDYEAHVVSQAVVRVQDGVATAMSDEEIEALRITAADAQLELYRRMIEWSDRYRVEYGAELYGCILNTFAENLRMDGFAQRIRAAFRSPVERHLDDLASGRERPLVLQHIAGTDGPIYSPLAG